MAYNQLSTYKTAWTGDDVEGCVIYTKTKIAEWNEDTITLNSGGWETVTTKRKMNQLAHQFCLGFGVFQKNYVWYVTTPQGDTVEFVDGMTIERKVA